MRWAALAAQAGPTLPKRSRMTVRCSKCGEELLGAVNRCWKCGQTFALRPEIDGRPPVMAEPRPPDEASLEAIVLEAASASAGHLPASAGLALPAGRALSTPAPYPT